MKNRIQQITGTLIFNKAFDNVDPGEMRKALEYINTELLELFNGNERQKNCPHPEFYPEKKNNNYVCKRCDKEMETPF